MISHKLKLDRKSVTWVRKQIVWHKDHARYCLRKGLNPSQSQQKAGHYKHLLKSFK